MSGSIRSRKVTEPKLNGFLHSENVSFSGGSIHQADNFPAYYYRSHHDTNSMMSPTNNLRSSGTLNSRSHVGFKEPLVSYHEENDPFSTPLKESDLSITPKDCLADARYLNSSDVMLPVKEPVAKKQNLNVTGVAKTVIHHSQLDSTVPVQYAKSSSSTDIRDSDSICKHTIPSQKTKSLNKLKADKLKYRKLEENSEALAKLKETIKKQKENRSPTSFTHGRGSSRLHNPEDALVSSSYNLGSYQPYVRKIAVGPAAPKYMGFNTAETRLKTPDGKIWKEDQFRREVGAISNKGKPKASTALFKDSSSTFLRSPKSKDKIDKNIKPNTQTKKKPIRKIGKIQSNNPTHKKAIITPSSWREGQKVAQAILGLGPVAKQPNANSLKADASTDKEEKKSRAFDRNPALEHTPGSRRNQSVVPAPSQPEEDSTEKSNDLSTVIDNMLSGARREGTPHNDLLSAEAKGILDDLYLRPSLPIEVSNAKPPEPSPRRTLKRKPPATVAEPEIPKVRHYNSAEVQQFMAKQKADRKRKQAEEKRMQREANEKRTKLLSDLDKRQKEARKKTVPSEPVQVKPKKVLHDTFTKPDPPLHLSQHPHIGYKERIASFMEKLEKINSADTDRTDSSDNTPRIPEQKGVSKFLQKLEECMQDADDAKPLERDEQNDRNTAPTSNEPPLSIDVSSINPSPEKQDDFPSARGYTGFYAKPLSFESHPTKLERIAALRAKSEALQERIEQESKKILEQPNYQLGLNERFSPKQPPSESRLLEGASRDVSPRTNFLKTITSSQFKSDTSSSEHSFPGMSGMPLGNRVKQDSPPKPHTSPRELSRSSFSRETWEVAADDQRTDRHANDDDFDEIDSRNPDNFSISDMMYRLNREEFCPKDKPSWSNKPGVGDDVTTGLPADLLRFSAFPSYNEKPPSDDLHKTSANEADQPPWKRGNGDKYSVMNLFTRKYLKNMKSANNKVHDSKQPKKVDMGTSTGLYREDPVRIPHQGSEQRSLVSGDSPEINPPTNQAPSNSSLLSLHDDPASALIKWSETLGGRSPCDEGGVSKTDEDVDEPNTRFYPPPIVESINQPSAMRFSPAVLEQKMAMELNRYETIEEQINQLAGSERTQGVAMAQQETVSIAQILQSRQQQHELEMERLALKAKEKAMEASQQLQSVQLDLAVRESKEKEKMAEGKAQMALQMQKETRKNLEMQNQVAQASIDALKRLGTSRKYSDTTSFDRSSSYTTSHLSSSSSEVAKHRNVLSDDRSPSSTVSEHSTTSVRGSFADGSIPEEIDRSGREAKESSSASSIKEMLGLNKDEDTERSISEHIADSLKSSVKPDKKFPALPALKKAIKSSPPDTSDAASVQFDDTITEDEMIEISKRAIMPSESHRRHHSKKSSLTSVPRFKFNHSDLSSDDTSPDHNKSYFSGLDESVISHTSLFGDADSNSFNRFMTDHVKQYMLEEEVRSRHQVAMLKLREKALKEKTQVELAWLEMKKRHIRNKGEDDKMPPIKKKKRAILLRWQVEKEEINKLKAANKAASQDRELMMKQQQDINRIMVTTQQMKEKLKSRGDFDGKSKPNLSGEFKSSTPVPVLGSSEPSESDNMSEVSLNVSTTQFLQRLKKSMVGLDGRRLTTREKVLLKRKKEAEKLLEWKRKLDKEEKKVFVMEQQALSAWGRSDASKPTKIPTVSNDKKGEVAKENVKKDETGATSTMLSSVVEEIDTPEHTEKSISSLQEEPKTTPRPQDASSEDTITEDYSQSFDSVDLSASKSEKKESEVAQDKKDKNKVDKNSKPSTLASKPDASTPLLSQKSLIKVRGPRRKDSHESWSDESFSQTQSETEQSDVECRVHHLKEELKRRKLIADHLKKQRKKKQKEHLRAQEASLKSQIEAYDAFIRSTQQELNLELESPSSGSPSILSHSGAAKPQIRSPRKNDQSRHISRSLRSTMPGISSPEASPRAGSQKHPITSLTARQQSDSESSGRSSRSLSFEEDLHSPEDVTPNGTSKSFPPRANDKVSSASTDTPPAALQDRPMKLDFSSSKSLRSMIPIPSTKLVSNKSVSERSADVTASKSQEKLVPQEKPKTITTSSSSSSDDADKDASVSTEKDVSEHLSEISTDKSEASIPLFDLTNQPVEDVFDDDKTPIASPLATPTPSTPVTPIADQPSNQFEVEGLGTDVSDGTVQTRSTTFLSKPSSLNKEQRQEVVETKEPAISRQQTASDITDKLFSRILEESVESALSLRKSSLDRSLQEAQKENKEPSVPDTEVTPTSADKRRHRTSEASPKLTTSAQNLLHILSQEGDKVDVNADKVSQNVMQDLVDETISKVLAVRKSRKDKLKQDEASPYKLMKKSPDHEDGREVEDIVMNADEGEVGPVSVRPVSPVFGTSQDTDEWFDDDFGLSGSRVTQPLDSQGGDSSIMSEISRMELPPIEYVIPHKRHEVVTLVDQAIDYLFAKQQINELFIDNATSFEEYDPPVEDADQFDLKAKSNRVFKCSIYELVRELMREAYGGTDEKISLNPWSKSKPKRRPSFCRSLPTSKKEVASSIRDEISRYYGWSASRRNSQSRQSLKWGSIRKKDSVDKMLIEELREEEIEWTDYDVDETAVKMQLTDTVFDELLNDTIKCLNRIEQSRNVASSAL